MATIFTVYGEAKSIAASERDPATIVNINSTGTVYYKTTADVSTGDTAIAAAASVEVTTPVYLIATAAAPVKVQVLRNADREESAFPESREPIRTVDGPLKSGTAGTLAGVAETDTVVYDKSTKTHFVNEGTAASPYWTPTSFTSPGLLAVYEDFRTLKGDVLAGSAPAITDTATVNYTGGGARVVGLGLAETDCGIAAGTDVEGSHVARLTATDEDGKGIGLAGSVVAEFQPDTHATIVVDTTLTNVSAITLRSLFVGFVGAAADNMSPPVGGSTTTVTFQPDDLAGLFMDAALTDADGIFGVSEKSNTAGTQTVAATGDATLAAAGTYQRFRVEVWADGTAVGFVDKAQVVSIKGATGAGTHATTTTALDADEEIIPLVFLESTSTATKSMDVKRFMYWGKRG